ncbi:MAG: S41 family peptidase [Flavisolibacter sp.]
MKCFVIFILSFFVFTESNSQEKAVVPYREDFEFFWKTLKEDYCYWDKKQTDWDKVKLYYGPLMDTVTSRHSFVLLMEKVINELYDHHASLSTNTKESQRLVPSGTDIWAEFKNGKAIITEVRIGFGAMKSGLQAGMEIVAVNGIPVLTALLSYLPKCLAAPDSAALTYALRLLIAGKFIDDRAISIQQKNIIKVFYPDRPVALLQQQHDAVIETRRLPQNMGYIRINNRLWDNGLIPVFDSVLKTMLNTNGLILDLRETPSGGNTTVARAIMGSFIKKEQFYQKHELTAEERTYGIKRSWLEIVSPRKIFYSRQLIVLANHWTGSVSEGITIGFDALKRARIIGTPLAGLNGAIYSYTMPNTKIGFSFPVEKLFHVNGLPREKYLPHQIVDLSTQKQGQDLILEQAIQYFKKHKKLKG